MHSEHHSSPATRGGRRRVWVFAIAAVAGAAAVGWLAEFTSGPAPQGSVAFENAWIRAPALGATVAAGYCDIVNDGEQEVVLVGFEGVGTVHMHETVERDGRVRMRPLERIAVGAGRTVSLAPGGKHLMLFGFDAAGADTATLEALYEDGGRQPVVFRVRDAATLEH